jgi:hypothetical protein
MFPRKMLRRSFPRALTWYKPPANPNRKGLALLRFLIVEISQKPSPISSAVQLET